MDTCQKCGQEICQSGYFDGFDQNSGQPVRVYTCADCRQKERHIKLFAKYGWAWPVLVVWNSILAVNAAYKFSKSEVLTDFVKSLSNETGLFEQKFSELAYKLHIRVEYVNRGGLVEITLLGFKEYGDATIKMTFDKFSLMLVETIDVQGDHLDVVNLTKSMTELLKSGIEFDKKLCHC